MNGYRLGIILSVIISLIICGTLAACGSMEREGAASDSTADSSSAAPAQTEPEATVPEATEPTFTEPAGTEPSATETEPSGAETEDPQLPEDIPGDEPAPEDAEVPEAADRQAIVDEAAAQLGVPYMTGGSSPEDGFDSSGFVFYCMNSAGYSFPRQIKKQLEAGERIAYNDLAVGDAVYFSEDEGGEASFCGIYAGGGLLIYSPVPDDFVKTANITTNYWTSRFVTGIRP